jgi:hypothetical protein
MLKRQKQPKAFRLNTISNRYNSMYAKAVSDRDLPRAFHAAARYAIAEHTMLQLGLMAS